MAKVLGVTRDDWTWRMHTSGIVLERWRLGRVRLPWAPDKDLAQLDCLETWIRDWQRTAKPRDTTSAKDCQSSSLGSVFLLSSHWVRRFLINPPVSNLYTIFRFFLPCPSQGWKVLFVDDIYTTLRSFGFPLIFPYRVLEVFHWLIPLSGFPPQSPITGLGGFLPATWSSFETYQLLYGARMFSLVTRFSSSVSHHLGWEVFHQVPIQGSHSRFPFKVPIQGSHSRFPSKFPFNRFHAQRSSRLKREAIVITWPSEWKSCDNYQPQLHLIRFDFHHGAWFLLIYATE